MQEESFTKHEDTDHLGHVLLLQGHDRVNADFHLEPSGTSTQFNTEKKISKRKSQMNSFLLEKTLTASEAQGRREALIQLLVEFHVKLEDEP